MAKSNQTKPQEPDYLGDVLRIVKEMDRKRLAKEDFSKDHDSAVKAVKIANGARGQGYISISKARGLIVTVDKNEKVRIANYAAKAEERAKRGQAKAKANKQKKKKGVNNEAKQKTQTNNKKTTKATQGSKAPVV